MFSLPLIISAVCLYNIRDLSVFFTDLRICQDRSAKLRVASGIKFCYIKNVGFIQSRKGGRLSMNIDDSVFAIKLYEMEEQYGKLQCRIRICEQGGRDKIHSELQKAREEYKENTLLLEEKAKTCRSQAVTRLTQAQLDYRKKIGESMRKQIVRDLHTPDSSSREDEEEADMLYAEFAMDFATLAMQQALISALKALDRQKSPGNTDAEQEAGSEDTESAQRKGEDAECRK